jgi:uncharacterized protein
MFFWDPTFFLLIPAFILAMVAQRKVRTTYAEYEKIQASSGLTGARAAQKILDHKGIHDVDVEEIPGQLSDHYDPRKKKLRLSTAVYNGRSLAALGVAAHEAGHAIQHHVSYFPLQIRSFVIPVASIGSNAALPLFFIGFLFALPPLMTLGILFFTAAVIFQTATLPVEYNASNRALALLTDTGICVESEVPAARKVLRAAGLTYVAALAMALAQLLRMILLRGNRR